MIPKWMKWAIGAVTAMLTLALVVAMALGQASIDRRAKGCVPPCFAVFN
jgi:hypothetical protein